MKQTVEWLEKGKDHSFYLIGGNDRRNYYPAIIGIAKDNSHIVYSRERLVSCFMKANKRTWEEAKEWIEHNVEHTLSYYGSTTPVILNNNFISSRNKNYTPLKIILDI